MDSGMGEGNESPIIECGRPPGFPSSNLRGVGVCLELLLCVVPGRGLTGWKALTDEGLVDIGAESKGLGFERSLSVSIGGPSDEFRPPCLIAAPFVLMVIVPASS